MYTHFYCQHSLSLCPTVFIYKETQRRRKKIWREIYTLDGTYRCLLSCELDDFHSSYILWRTRLKCTLFLLPIVFIEQCKRQKLCHIIRWRTVGEYKGSELKREDI